MRTRCAGWIVVLALVPSSAVAQGTCPQASRVEELVTQAAEARRNSLPADALRLLEEGYGLCHRPSELARMGYALEALGRWVSAYERLSAALEASSDPWVVENRAILEQQRRVAETHLGRVELTGQGTAAEVFLDDQPVGRWPRQEPWLIPAGTMVVVSVRAAGCDPWEERLTVTAGQPRSLAVSQRCGPRALTPHRGTTLQTLAWTSLGLAVVGAGLGLTGLVLREGRWSDYESRCNDRGMMREPSGMESTCTSLYDAYTATGPRTLLLGGFLAGGVFAAAAVTFFGLAGAGRPTRERSAGVGCGVGPGDLGLACAGRF